MSEAWQSAPLPAQMAAASAEALRPQSLVEWGTWLLQQIVTLDVALCVVSLALGLLAGVGATEFAKRFPALTGGELWRLKLQLCAALWGAVVTCLLIVALTTWSASGQLVACLAIGPPAAFYSPRLYDVLRRLFPALMAKAGRKLRGGGE